MTHVHPPLTAATTREANCQRGLLISHSWLMISMTNFWKSGATTLLQRCFTENKEIYFTTSKGLDRTEERGFLKQGLIGAYLAHKTQSSSPSSAVSCETTFFSMGVRLLQTGGRGREGGRLATAIYSTNCWIITAINLLLKQYQPYTCTAGIFMRHTRIAVRFQLVRTHQL